MNNKNKNFVLLSIGSNLGAREQVVLCAVSHLEESKILTELQVSQWYETEPVGNLDQPWFLNIAVSGYTELTPYALIKMCKSIEYLADRQIRKKWRERELDIDIILYSNQIIDLPAIKIPHPRMHERRFVLKPLNDIAPDVVHPIFQKTISQLLNECPDQSEVKLYQGGMKE
jgi:2-amino-4-hydroxy-6-hydroxymethyldihydropteridine diphosphokinase